MLVDHLSAAVFLLTFLPFPAGEPNPAPKGRAESGKEEPKKKAFGVDRPGADPAGGGRGLEAAPAPPAIPNFKALQAEEKFQEGMEKFKAEDYSAARSLWNACLKDASAPADKKALQAWIDDTKLGLEIQAAQKLADGKSERKAIARAETALKANPKSSLAAKAKKFVSDTEDLIYNIIDDFEQGDGLEGEAENQDPNPGSGLPRSFSSSRWISGMSFNSDPAFVHHGKGSMKWTAKSRNSGRGKGGPGGPGQDFQGYRSSDLKDLFAKIAKLRWRYLIFYVYLPEAEEGNLQVTLAPTAQAEIADCLYLEKLIDFRGKKGWLPVQINLLKDFGNTANVKLEEMRFIRIGYMHVNRRTFYLDFVHLE